MPKLEPRWAVRRVVPMLLTALLLALPTVGAHDIPADIIVRAFVKPDGQYLRVLLRVPLGAIVDVDFPQRGPGYLDFARLAPALPAAASRWMNDYAELYEGDRRLASPRIVATRVSLPSDTSFGSYEAALAHVTTAPMITNDTELVWNQALLDVLYQYPIQSDRSDFSIAPVVERLGLKVTTVIRFMPPDGVMRAFEFVGDPGRVRLDPGWHQAALRFVRSGFLHILDGTDHLLFLLCLVIPFRRLRSLILVVTAFTVAHSITLISSAYNLVPNALWFPPLIETLIAVSIVYMALENIVSDRLQRRWLIAFAFGLVHGFGFSFALSETLQFAGEHLLTSLFPSTLVWNWVKCSCSCCSSRPSISCSVMASRSVPGRSSCQRSSHTPVGTGCSSAETNCVSSGSSGRRSVWDYWRWPSDG